MSKIKISKKMWKRLASVLSDCVQIDMNRHSARLNTNKLDPESYCFQRLTAHLSELQRQGQIEGATDWRGFNFDLEVIEWCRKQDEELKLLGRLAKDA